MATSAAAMKSNRSAAWTLMRAGPACSTNPPNRSTNTDSRKAATAAASAARAHRGGMAAVILLCRQRALFDANAPQHQRSEHDERDRPAHHCTGGDRTSGDLSGDAYIIRMRHPPVRSGKRPMRTGRDQDAERPPWSQRDDGPVLQRLRRREDDQAEDECPAGIAMSPGAFGQHREECRGIGVLHRGVNVAARLD